MDISPINETKESLWEHLQVIEDERNKLLNEKQLLIILIEKFWSNIPMEMCHEFEDIENKF